MFCFSSRWRKASKCKRVLKEVQCRLKLLKNKRSVISSYSRHDIAQMLRYGERNRALDRVEQLYLDENQLSLYCLLLDFTDFILLHFSYIQNSSQVLDDGGITEAVSTLVFASYRCGDLPELRTLRLLFEERYGKLFVETALDLLPDHSVSTEVIQKLSVTSVSYEVSYDAKSKLLVEIDTEYGVSLKVLALQHTPEFHKQVIEEEKQVMEEKHQESLKVSALIKYTPEFHKQVIEEEKQVMEEKHQESRGEASGKQRSVRDCVEEQVVGKRPDPIEETKNVHPKLPDYDHIAAHFTALKKKNV